MNELLGWYGYDKLDRREAQSLTLAHLARLRTAAAAAAAMGPAPSPALRLPPRAGVRPAALGPAALDLVRPRTPPSDAESPSDLDAACSRRDSTGSSQSSPSRSGVTSF